VQTIKILVSGLVQGIFYRKFVKETADKYHIKGEVKNLNLNEVRIIAQSSDKDELDSFIYTCKKNYKPAIIQKFEVSDFTTKVKYQSFEIMLETQE